MSLHSNDECLKHSKANTRSSDTHEHMRAHRERRVYVCARVKLFLYPTYDILKLTMFSFLSKGHSLHLHLRFVFPPGIVILIQEVTQKLHTQLQQRQTEFISAISLQLTFTNSMVTISVDSKSVRY